MNHAWSRFCIVEIDSTTLGAKSSYLHCRDSNQNPNRMSKIEITEEKGGSLSVRKITRNWNRESNEWFYETLGNWVPVESPREVAPIFRTGWRSQQGEPFIQLRRLRGTQVERWSHP